MRSKIYSQYQALRLMVVLALVLTMFTPAMTAQAASPNIVISQVYGGGASAGATYKYDYVELYNRGTTAVNINGWSVQYAATTGSNWTKTVLPNVSIQPGSFYLIQEGGTTTTGADLPTPDLVGASGTPGILTLAGAAGKIVLLNTNTTITSGTACPSGATVVDIVGYGSATTCSETAPTANLSVTTAALRNGKGSTDTDNNSADFTIGTPTPRNSLYNPSGVGAANPASAAVGGATLLTVAVTPGTNPASTGLAVTADLSAIGGAANQTFSDNGTNGDVTAGDNIFSFQATIAAGTSVGAKTLPATISDSQLRTRSLSIGLDVVGTTNPTGSGAANPNSVGAGNSTLLTVTVTPGANPASTGLAVTADLSAIGGAATQTFYDDGTDGDVTAGDQVFSYQATVAGGTPTGSKNLPVSITDAQARSGSTSIALTVAAPTNPSGTGAADPSSVTALDSSLLTVVVTPGTLPTSTGLAVTVDLSAIGGLATQTFYDNGTNGDATASDHTFSFQATVPSGTTLGAKSLPVSISDAQARTGSTSIALTVVAPVGLSASATAAPLSGLPGATTLLKVTVSPAMGPLSTGLAVTADLTEIGGSATQTFYDDGTNGDVAAGDKIFSYQTSAPLGSSTGPKTLSASVSDAQARTANVTFYYTVNTASGCGSTATYIHDIQGSGTSSSMTGSTLTIEGVVVGDYQSNNIVGYYVEEEATDWDSSAATSEGIFVYNTAYAVSAGDQVRVTGKVAEYGTAPTTLTEISTVTAVTICSSGQSGLVPATTFSLPMSDVSDQEKYEGMLVNISQELTVVNNYNLGYYGQVGLAQGGYVYQFTHINAPSTIGNTNYQAEVAKRVVTLDDASIVEDPDPIVYPDPGLSASNTLRVGYTLPGGLTGIMDQRRNGTGTSASSTTISYKILPVGTVNFNTASNPRPATSPTVSGTLRVAFMNLLNYFNGDGAGGGFPTARGAATAEEFTRQRDKTIPAVNGVNAAVIGVMEVENDYDTGTLSAIYDLVSGLNTAAGAGTYAYINPAAKVGTDVIAVGIIYKPALVTPVGAFKTLTTGAFSANNRVPLAQTFQQNSNGEKFTVVVNHFKSKGSTCTGDPDTGDGQGNCNLTRLAAAQELATWLDGDPTGSGDPDFIIMGDLNAYAYEDPITRFTSLGYTNLIHKFLGQESYSYQYSGQVGYLDHLLGTSTLTDQAMGVAEWHINSAEPSSLDYTTQYKSASQQISLYSADPYYAADHDPAILGLDLATDESDLAASYGSARHTRGKVYLGTRFADGNSAIGTVFNSATSTNDGVRPTPGTYWTVAGGGSVDVTVTGIGTNAGYVTGWVDWNQDGDFNDTGETIFANEAFGSGTNTRTISFSIPVGTAVGSSSFNARFRVYPQAQVPDARHNPTGFMFGAPERYTNASPLPTGDVYGGESEDFNWGFGPTVIDLESFSGHSGVDTAWSLMALGLIALGLVLRRRMAS